MTRYVAFDTETFPISEETPFPEPVCLTWYDGTDADLLTCLEDDIEGFMIELLEDPDVVLIGQNTKYDTIVLSKKYPALLEYFIDAYLAGRIRDCAIKDKFHYLATQGSLTYARTQQGNTSLQFSMEAMLMRHLGRDRSAEKKSGVRVQYFLYSEIPAAEWPKHVIKYAVDDAIDTRDIYFAIPYEPPRQVETLRVTADFALGWLTDFGVPIDHDNVKSLAAYVDSALDESNFTKAIERGILIPSQPETPYANGARDHVEGCHKKKSGGEFLCDCPVKMKKATDASLKTLPLKMAVFNACEELELPVELTDSGKDEVKRIKGKKLGSLPVDDPFWEDEDNFKYISTARDFLEITFPGDPALEDVYNRGLVLKLRTSYLPVFNWHGHPTERVFFGFDILKETGRTSSKSSTLYPSSNGQQVDPRARPCFVADEGHVICSVDYSGIELSSLAEQVYNTLGHSTHMRLLQDGVDLHSFLGWQLCKLFKDFRGSYKDFLALEQGSQEEQEFFDHWRTFAKPIGLGRPGGMGDGTTVAYARGYGINIGLDQAKAAGQVWHQTFPEMGEYFRYVRGMKDPDNTLTDPETGEIKGLLRYVSPLGMVRAGATYTAACNGFGLQTPTAEGALVAMTECVFDCIDARNRSILFGVRPFVFIHDESLSHVPYHNPELATRQALAIADAMVAGMKQVIRVAPVSAEPVFMHHWHKKAKPVWEDGILKPWQPSPE